MPTQDIFIKVKSTEEKNEVFDFLIYSRKEVLAKTTEKDSELFFLFPEKFEKGKLLCSMKDTVIPTSLKNEKGLLVIQFNSRTEKYLSQTTFSIEDNKIILDTKSDLFQLQRREDFRLKFPPNYKAVFVLKKINGKDINLPLPKLKQTILDISGGGCRIENNLTNHEVKSKDILEGEILLPNREPLVVRCEARYVAPVPDRVQNQMIGLMFLDLTTITKNRIVALVMDIYRELFSRMT